MWHRLSDGSRRFSRVCLDGVRAAAGVLRNFGEYSLSIVGGCPEGWGVM